MRILGRNDFFVKNTGVFESIQNISRVVFDKTGTLTYAVRNEIKFEGKDIDETHLRYIKSLTLSFFASPEQTNSSAYQFGNIRGK